MNSCDWLLVNKIKKNFDTTRLYIIFNFVVSTYLIGCFTALEIVDTTKLIENSTSINYTGASSHDDCRKFCRTTKNTYALLSSERKPKVN